MNWGENNRVDHFAVCHSAGCYTHANPVNPVIVSSTQVSSFQFQVSSTYSWVDSVWTETVTRVHELEPDPVAMQTTRRSIVHGRAGNRLAERTELMTAPGVWEPIDGVAYEYDVNGRETKRTAFNGLTTTSAWSGTCCGKSSETAPDGTRTTFTYDTAGRVVVRTVLDPAPIETHIAYDALGRRVATWTTNRVAQLGTPVLRTTYDALGRVVSQTDELGNTTSYSYSANERTTTVTQPTGATQITVTDTAGRIVALSGTAVAPRFYTYGVNSDLSAGQAGGTQWTKVYHGTDATAPAWTKTTENMLDRTVREEKPGYNNTLLATTYTYDNGGGVLSRTQSAIDNSVPSVLSVDLNTYDRYGDLLFSALDVNQNGVIDFNGPDRVTGYTAAYIARDGALRQESTQTVYPDFNSDCAVTTTKSRRKLTNLGAFASVAEAEDIRGNVTTSTQAVDPSTGTRISTTTVPTSIQPQVQIQRYGLLMESISTTAVTNRYAYDALNRRVAVTDGRGNTTTTTYNALGQVAYVEDAATNRTTYVYDQYGRQIETIDALNQSTYTVYDLRGNVVRQYGATYPVWYEYDNQGRMIAMATTRDTTLDPATVDSLEDPSLDVTQWNYDPATGLLVQKLYDDLSAEQAGGKGPSYTYTPDGKLATRTWARGIVTSYAYDVLGSVLSVNYSDATPDVTYTYDRIGRQLSAIAAGVSTNLYAYSTNTLELVSEIQNGVVIDRSRDAFGRESGIALESDYDVSYAYDGYGRFASVAHAQSTNTFVYSYVPGSTLVSGMTASSGHAWTRSHEPQRNLITSVTNSFNGNLISAFDYANDALGRRTARLDSLLAGVAVTNAFGYNMRSEVTSANMGTNAYGYIFDLIGNRIVSTNNADVTSYAANELNQYTNILCASAPPREPSHDDDGNMLTNGVWSYVWDGENRLIGVASNGVLLATHTYDHRSRRVGKISHEGTKTRRYVYDGWNLIQELTHTQTHTLTNLYTWGLDISGSLQGAGGVGGLLAVVQDGGTYYPTFDANGNAIDYTSADGILAAHYEYSPFGETVVQSGVMADFFVFRFSTKYWEGEAKLYYYGYRFYEPNIGRWLNRDPIDDAASNQYLEDVADLFTSGESLYGFSGNEPLTRIDSLGLAYGNPVPPVVISPPPGPSSSCPRKCCNGTMVQMVPIWNCTRALGGVINYLALKHGYICCGGGNSDCFGVQKYKPSCMKSCLKSHSKKYCKKLCYAQQGDTIEPEVDTSGSCVMLCVTPDEKNAACRSPSMPWDYSVRKWQHCYSWADDVTTTKCK